MFGQPSTKLIHGHGHWSIPINITINHCSFSGQSQLQKVNHGSSPDPIIVLGLANHSFSFVIRQARNLHPVIVDNTSPIIVTYLYLANHGTSQPSIVLSQPMTTLHQKHYIHLLTR
jgi:hypothetical protein